MRAIIPDSERPSVPAVSLQPLLDFLASKHASEDSEDTSFDAVAGSVLAEYAERRDELEERHERDDLVSFTSLHFPSQPPPSSTTRQFLRMVFFTDRVCFYFFSLKGETLFAPFVVRGGESHTGARDEAARLTDRHRGHHIAKVEATTRT